MSHASDVAHHAGEIEPEHHRGSGQRLTAGGDRRIRLGDDPARLQRDFPSGFRTNERLQYEVEVSGEFGSPRLQPSTCGPLLLVGLVDRLLQCLLARLLLCTLRPSLSVSLRAVTDLFPVA